jgi:peptidoglycan/LPS O-acetylase OafA/YrhL
MTSQSLDSMSHDLDESRPADQRQVQHERAGEAERFAVLDSWRGLSALLVALYHLPVGASLFVNPLVRGSFLFVDFFFVLSGFVISSAYEGRINTKPAAVEFLIKRIGRLWPVHVATLLALVALTSAISLARFWFGSAKVFEAPTIGGFLANLFMLNGLGIEGLTSINVPSWSISCELMVYALFCLVALTGAPRLLTWLLMGAVGASLILSFSTRHMDVTNVLGIARCVYGFALGVIARSLYLRFRFAYRRSMATPAEILAVSAAILFVIASYKSVWSLLAPIVFFAVILVFAFEAGALSEILKKPALQLLGSLSFTIYMVHYTVAAAIYQVSWTLRRIDTKSASPFFDGRVQPIDAGGQLYGWLLGLLYIGLVLGLAYGLHLLVEEPLKLRSYAFAKRWRRRQE